MGQAAEEEAEQQHHGQRLQHGPGKAQHRLLVTHLDVTPGQEVQQLTVSPQLTKVEARRPAVVQPQAGRARGRCGEHGGGHSHVRWIAAWWRHRKFRIGRDRVRRASRYVGRDWPLTRLYRSKAEPGYVGNGSCPDDEYL